MLIRSKVRGLVDGFLGRAGVRREDLAAFIVHPGGQKLLTFIEEEMGLTPADTECSWHVLREYGNQSSVSVLFVLNEWLSRHAPSAGAPGLVAAFGPGFTANLLLLRWA